MTSVDDCPQMLRILGIRCVLADHPPYGHRDCCTGCCAQHSGPHGPWPSPGRGLYSEQCGGPVPAVLHHALKDAGPVMNERRWVLAGRGRSDLIPDLPVAPHEGVNCPCGLLTHLLSSGPQRGANSRAHLNAGARP